MQQLQEGVIHIVSTHKKWQNYTPSFLVLNLTHLAWSPFMRTYFWYIHPSSPPHSTPNKFLFRFKFSALSIPRLLSFSLVFEIKFHFKVKVYTFLYTVINGNVIASFVEKRKVLRCCDERKQFCVCTQPWTPPPPHPYTQLQAFGWNHPLPLCAYVLCGWPRIKNV